MIIAEDAHSTADDTRIAADVMRASGWRRGIVVTTAYHTRRAGWTFNRIWSPLGLGFSVHASSDPRFDADRWWVSERAAKAVVLEYMKFGVYIFRYGLFH